MAKTKLAVTGAFGFVGSHFIEMFADKYDIVAISRQQCTHPACDTAASDYSRDSLAEALEGCSAVLHLAAARPYRKKSDFLRNLALDQCLFDTAHRLGIENVVFTSTRGVYGSLPAPWRETMQPAPENLYALAKQQSEAAAAYFNRKGMCIKSLRIAQVFGEGEYESSAISTFIRRIRENEPVQITVRGIVREYIYVKDLCNAFDKALSHEKTSGIFNVGSGETLTLEEIARTIAAAFGKPHLVTLAPHPKTVNEYSLMDSSLFRQHFGWKPAYTFQSAAEEIAKKSHHPNSEP